MPLVVRVYQGLQLAVSVQNVMKLVAGMAVLVSHVGSVVWIAVLVIDLIRVHIALLITQIGRPPLAYDDAPWSPIVHLTLRLNW